MDKKVVCYYIISYACGLLGINTNTEIIVKYTKKLEKMPYEYLRETYNLLSKMIIEKTEMEDLFI